jgi:hypothetical protein
MPTQTNSDPAARDDYWWRDWHRRIAAWIDNIAQLQWEELAGRERTWEFQRGLRR